MNGRYSTPPDAAKLEESTQRLEQSNDTLERRLAGDEPKVPVIYIAGPFTAPTPDRIRDNIRRAATLGHEVRRLGAYPFVPHLIGAPYVLGASAIDLPDLFGYGHWIKETLAYMKLCDGVLMTPDWETSNGARGERDDARGRGQPVFLTIEQLKDWMRARR